MKVAKYKRTQDIFLAFVIFLLFHSARKPPDWRFLFAHLARQLLSFNLPCLTTHYICYFISLLSLSLALPLSNQPQTKPIMPKITKAHIKKVEKLDTRPIAPSTSKMMLTTKTVLFCIIFLVKLINKTDSLSTLYNNTAKL